MWKKFQPNPCGRRVGDCSVRAISKALSVSWEDAYNLLADAGYRMCDIMNADSVLGAVLREYGFYRDALPNTCPDCYTVRQFCKDHPRGIYVLGFGGHVATVVDGDLYDSWDSSNEIPIYYWHREN